MITNHSTSDFLQRHAEEYLRRVAAMDQLTKRVEEYAHRLRDLIRDVPPFKTTLERPFRVLGVIPIHPNLWPAVKYTAELPAVVSLKPHCGYGHVRLNIKFGDSERDVTFRLNEGADEHDRDFAKFVDGLAPMMAEQRFQSGCTCDL